MVASWYFTWGFITMRPAGLLSFQEFMFRSGARGQYLGNHRFCLMSWRLVDGWILYLKRWFSNFSVTQTLNWIYVYRSVTYISWSSDFALYFEDYLINKWHYWDIASMWCKDLPHYMDVGLWHTFHVPAILCYILKSIKITTIRNRYNQIPHPALKTKREITKYINCQQFTKDTRSKPNERLFSQTGGHSAT